MKLKLFVLAFLFPFSAVALIILSFYLGFPNVSMSLTVHIAYIFTILIASKVVQFHFRICRWKISTKEILIALLLGLLLFCLFYMEKVILGDYKKVPFNLFQIISSVLIAPFLEEIFSKGILMDSLRKILKNPIKVILIIAVYFWILHFPTIMITHLIFGIATAALYYFRKNLTQIIIIHAFYNAGIVILNSL